MRRSQILKSMGFAAFSAALSGTANAGPSTYMGEIIVTAASYCPYNTVEAVGQLMAIADNPALFSLYGTTYGGNGTTSFGMPDLRGRAPVHYGQGPGLTYYPWGTETGIEHNYLTVANIPPHSHNVLTTSQPPNTNDPDDAHLASAASPLRAVTGSSVDPSYDFASTQIGPSGSVSPDPVNNVQPILAMRYCITVNGSYPPRS
ncbi:tail fiber protein [Ponticaulis sp.]|uniref:phage tail protein n=1 Tax=Ponticaulis sp. TaxID=2020902 RepID=UPI000C3700F3|nr:tail fiber protein [Ponticaulis sp.]MAJ10662.1 phage tail protein [Ponticaulis sp.]HBH89031.1 phage tail protein [Hyphomonadaceae bacterium]HBJ93345.1 phage tail protein [Hyphomonadaceae bacterium]|tara:strand:- start:3617 stop:4225 length:609 start_codon:yes stop_codon:yes gene_type:complete